MGHEAGTYWSATTAAIRDGVALPSRVFAWLVLVFSVGFSMLALTTRRWALAWVALAGSTVASFLGLLAVWSRQTAPEPHPGPGIGLIVAWITVIVLTINWARAVWARTAVQLAAEEQRRRVVAERQKKGLLDGLDDDTGDEQAGPAGSLAHLIESRFLRAAWFGAHLCSL